MAPAPGLLLPAAVRMLRSAARKGLSAIRDRLPQAGEQLEPALVRNAPKINHQAGRIGQHHLKQNPYNRSTYKTQNISSRFYSTASKSGGSQGASKIGRAVGRVTTTSPFASTLRPKLCGALPRSSGGYGLGGSARYFSHTPAAPADVIYNVSQAMRAFMLSGKDKAYNQRKGGHASYVKGQIRMQLAASSTDSHAPGAYVDFRLTPTLKCLSPNAPVGYTSLDSSRGGFMEELQNDFTDVVSDISAVFQDLRRLSSLGDLPITLVGDNVLRVHFRGCDAELVNRLCDEVGVCRGVVHEDERFAFDRLVAPSVASEVDWRDMMSSSEGSTYSGDSYSFYEQGGIVAMSDETASLPPWTESGEEFYDEIDPGGEEFCSGSSGQSSFMVASNPMDSLVDLEDIEAYQNPWVTTPARSVAASCA